MKTNIIVAISENNAIGRGGDIPWHISEDLKYFKRQTSGCPVIMGRKTFESIGRPLPGRKNIVISRSGFAAEGILPVASLEEALWLADSLFDGDAVPASGERGAFIIGGGQIYAQAMDLADRLYITHIHTVVEDADTYFPEISPEVWKMVESSEVLVDPASGLEFQFVVYDRIK